MNKPARGTDPEEALRDSVALYRSLVETLPQNIFRKDTRHRLTFANGRYCALLDKKAEEVLGLSDRDLFPRKLAEKYMKDDRRVMKTGRVFETVERHVTPDGKALYVQVVKSPLYSARGKLLGVQGIFWDVTERHEMQAEMKRMNRELRRASITDPLTGAYNRLYVSRELPALIGAFGRGAGTLSAVMFDIDDFKKVNDTYGHAAGDLALQTCVQGARTLLRRKSDLLVRLGGDEFVVFLFGTRSRPSRQYAGTFALKLMDAVRRARIPASRSESVRISISIGVANLDFPGLRRPDCIERLLMRADEALYEAKRKGKNRIVGAKE